jgi:hypothetical protein
MYALFTVVTTVAGGISGTTGAYADGAGSNAGFSGLHFNGAAIDQMRGNVLLADTGNQRVRVVTPDGTVTTLAGGVLGAVSSNADGIGSNAGFNRPADIAVDYSREQIQYIAVDVDGNRIRSITPAGVVSTIAGGASVPYADGNGTQAGFNAPISIAIDASGTIYVGEYGNNRIRKILPVAGMRGTDVICDHVIFCL